MSSTSASAMLFEGHDAVRVFRYMMDGGKDRASDIKHRLSAVVIGLLLSTVWCLPPTVCWADLVDRIAAFIDDRVITLSELQEAHERLSKRQPGLSLREALDTLINRTLLLNEAKRLRIEGKTEEEIVTEYIEIKIRAYVRIKESDLEDYYLKNYARFEGASYEAVREKIEEYLTEQEVNRLLKSHIEELKSTAYVKIVMEELQ